MRADAARVTKDGQGNRRLAADRHSQTQDMQRFSCFLPKWIGYLGVAGRRWMERLHCAGQPRSTAGSSANTLDAVASTVSDRRPPASSTPEKGEGWRKVRNRRSILGAHYGNNICRLYWPAVFEFIIIQKRRVNYSECRMYLNSRFKDVLDDMLNQ